VRRFFDWPATIYNASNLRAASGWWRAVRRLHDRRMDSRRPPLRFDNPAFGLQFLDEFLQIHHLLVYARPARYAISPSTNPMLDLAPSASSVRSRLRSSGTHAPSSRHRRRMNQSVIGRGALPYQRSIKSEEGERELGAADSIIRDGN
jgi:hypothetical protein